MKAADAAAIGDDVSAIGVGVGGRVSYNADPRCGDLSI